jgi:predicted aldo/keto reductase-like oxidoreductase
MKFTEKQLGVISWCIVCAETCPNASDVHEEMKIIKTKLFEDVIIKTWFDKIDAINEYLCLGGE